MTVNVLICMHFYYKDYLFLCMDSNILKIDEFLLVLILCELVKVNPHTIVNAFI